MKQLVSQIVANMLTKELERKVTLDLSDNCIAFYVAGIGGGKFAITPSKEIKILECDVSEEVIFKLRDSIVNYIGGADCKKEKNKKGETNDTI